MNLFLREMKANRKSLIIWCFGILFMIVAGIAKFKAFSGSGQSMSELMSQLPKSLQAIMGMGKLDLSTVTGFYGMLFIYLLLMAAIHALMLGANIFAKEERDKTTEFLMVKPISRTQIVTSKLLAVLVNLVIFNLVTLVLSVSMVKFYIKPGESINDIYLLMVGMFLGQLIFAALGSWLAAVSHKPKRAASMGTAILLVMFILSIAIDLNSKLENLKYITPFKFYDAKTVLIDGALDPVYVTISVVVTVAMICATYVFYRKRDLNV